MPDGKLDRIINIKKKDDKTFTVTFNFSVNNFDIEIFGVNSGSIYSLTAQTILSSNPMDISTILNRSVSDYDTIRVDVYGAGKILTSQQCLSSHFATKDISIRYFY